MIRFMASHPVAANLLMGAAFVLAILALPGVERSMAPDVPQSLIDISIAYPGADPTTVSDSICRRVERAIDRIPELVEVSCEAKFGGADLLLKKREFSNFDRFFTDVRVAIDSISDFPAEVEPPIIRPSGTDIAVVSVAVAAPMTPSVLKDYASDLRNRLEALPDVSKVSLEGFSERELEVSVSVSALRRLAMSIPDLAAAIGAYNVDEAVGTLRSSSSDSRVRMSELRDTPQELARLTIEGDKVGSLIALGDIAKISDGFTDPYRRIEFDEEPAALLTIFRTRSEDTIDVYNSVAALLEHESQSAPARFTMIQDTSALVEERLAMMVKNGFLGLLLVFASLWLFFGTRYSLWVALGLPISIAVTIVVMVALGISFNLITTVAMLIAVGVVMDDSIVIAETIAARRRAGDPPLTASIHGVRQMTPAVLSSFATTCAVFAPLIFLAGELGAVMAFIPITLLLILSISLAEAIFVLPHHLASAPIAMPTPGSVRTEFERLFDRLKDRVATPVFHWSVNQPHLAVGLSVAVFFLSIAILASGLLKFEAFPNVEGDVVEAHILMKPGVTARETQQVAYRVARDAELLSAELSGDDDEAPFVQHVLMNLGVNKVAGVSSAEAATVSLELSPAADRSLTANAFLKLWRDRVGDIPNVSVIDYADQDLGAGGRPISFKLAGNDIAELDAAAAELKSWLLGYEGIIATVDNVGAQQSEFSLSLRPLAITQDITARDISQQLRGAVFGIRAAELAAKNDNYDIYVRARRGQMSSRDNLESFPIVLPNGEIAPLSSLAELSVSYVPARITRVNGMSTIKVDANIDPAAANAASIVTNTQTVFLPSLLEAYPNIEMQLEGQSADAARTGTSILLAFVGGLLAVYVLLGIQFRSYGLPLIIMSIIPLCLIGVVWGHFLTGTTFSIPSLIGCVGLSGIAVNNAILLVQAAQRAFEESSDVAAAIVEGCRTRFRAMMLTSLTTLAGLFPLLLETSHHAVSIKPLVTSLAFGLFGTTIVILIVIPAALSMSRKSLGSRQDAAVQWTEASAVID